MSRHDLIKIAMLTALVSASPACAQDPDQYAWTQKAYQLTTNAVSMIQAGKAAEALGALQTVLQITPNSYQVNFYIGYALEQLGRFPEALAWYEKANQLDPAKPEALLGISRIYYEQNDYKRALPILEQLVDKHRASEATYASLLALSKCYAETGRISDFVSTMQEALSFKSKDPSAWKFAGQEMDYLKQYDLAIKYYSEYLKRFANYPDAAEVTKRLDVLSYEKEEAEELKEVADGFKLHSDTDDLSSFVIFLDPKHSGVSDKAVSRVLLGLSQIPKYYRHALENAGYKVLIAPTVLDAMPELAGQNPRGYLDGADWHSINGAFDRKNKHIVVGEKAHKPGEGSSQKEGALDEVVQHEFGHAYDSYLGGLIKSKSEGEEKDDPNPEFSHSPAFSQAYDKDVAAVPDQLKSILAYYLQGHNAGKEELFAQIWVLFFGHQPEPDSPREHFQKAFPSVLALMISARQNDPDYFAEQKIRDQRLHENLLTPEERAREMTR